MHFSGIVITLFIRKLIIGENGIVRWVLTKGDIAYQLHSVKVYFWGCLIVTGFIFALMLGIVALKVLILNLKWFLCSSLMIMLSTMIYSDLVCKNCYIRVEKGIGSNFDKMLVEFEQFFYATPERMCIYVAALFFVFYSLMSIFRNREK